EPPGRLLDRATVLPRRPVPAVPARGAASRGFTCRRSTVPLGSPTPRVYPPAPLWSPVRAGARSEPGERKGARSPQGASRRASWPTVQNEGTVVRQYGGEVRR